MVDANASSSGSRSGATPTLRVTFAYRRGEVRLASAERVAMIAPPATTPPPDKGATGYWFEVRDADGALLAHRALHNPMRVDTEVFSAVDRQTITRIPVADPQGEFEILVADAPAAASLRLWGPPADAGLQSVPARELLRIDFDVLRRAAEGAGGEGGRK